MVFCYCLIAVSISISVIISSRVRVLPASYDFGPDVGVDVKNVELLLCVRKNIRKCVFKGYFLVCNDNRRRRNV